jgi:hypothetical protein
MKFILLILTLMWIVSCQNSVEVTTGNKAPSSSSSSGASSKISGVIGN